jgi:Fe-S-cluster containining protein
MDEFMRTEIDGGIRAMQALSKLVPVGGLKNLEKAQEEMDELISPEFEPYFSANAALHLLAECKRCGWCCRNVTIAISIDNCRRIARHLGLSLKRFMMDYTRPHELKGDKVGNARMMKKVDGSFCAFFDSSLPGCRIHSFKPQVCTAALYLAKMNLLLCEEHGKLSTFAYCPGDVELRARIADFALMLNGDVEAKLDLERLFTSTRPEVELFRLLLRLKGMEIYFGPDRAAVLARRLGLKRVQEDEELKSAAFLYAVSLRGEREKLREIS